MAGEIVLVSPLEFTQTGVAAILRQAAEGLTLTVVADAAGLEALKSRVTGPTAKSAGGDQPTALLLAPEVRGDLSYAALSVFALQVRAQGERYVPIVNLANLPEILRGADLNNDDGVNISAQALVTLLTGL
ncbi:hypothetical protein A2160_03970 [Candidatus Beckwithbacteria bacterium RBG_13_42_9]|uniref:Uncharacterized protein n=1 Tax=Candidatus Beckwithbacteria bacterium RBG_13_42_9 TaxID=1797457 RepID=A0A1F5E5U4_9BACT|nr:MAG: hypothetical protein A2160_03970 [Candidatus Beckwithbacteria bacterium RBG_13_42_9]